MNAKNEYPYALGMKIMTKDEREDLQILVTKYFISKGENKSRAYAVACLYSDDELSRYDETIDREKLEIDLRPYLIWAESLK